MDDTLAVYIIEGVRDVSQGTAGFCQRKRRATDTRPQGASFHKWHDDVVVHVAIYHALTRVIDGNEVDIMERGHQMCLANKAAQHLLIFTFKYFDRYFALKMRVVSLINISHPSPTDQVLQMITTESSPLQSWHTVSPSA